MTRGRLPLAVFLALAACGDREPLPKGDFTPRKVDHDLAVDPAARDAIRADALRRAAVWRPPAVPIGEADLSRNADGPGAFAATDLVTCKFVLKSSDGRSPKFQCVLDGGEVVKVKYGRNNPETFGEVAATRLTRALGFGADRVDVVAGVRCLGCPAFPYPKFGIFDALRADASRAVDFELAVVERRMPGRAIEGGWSWGELRAIDPAAGGAGPAEVDALRLLAVFLAHWDGKPENQRLTCAEASTSRCEDPLAYIQDLGQTFGPKSIDLDGWSRTPMWKEAEACTVSMKEMPWAGSTFEDVAISEGGRALLAGLLRQLDEGQVKGLFVGARFTEFFRNPRSADEDAWTRAFLGRVAQIADRPPCPGGDAGDAAAHPPVRPAADQ